MPLAARPLVFVSSTYLDNRERREWVREAIERAEMTPLCMERWTADPSKPQELCIHRVREADVFLCVLAWRYGWIPEGESKSITELEYEEAVRLEMPRLIFLLDQPLSQVNIETQFDPDDPWRKQQLLQELKARLRKEQTSIPFGDEMLMTLVLQALYRWKEQRWKATAQHAAPVPELPPIAPYRASLAEYLEWLEREHSAVTLPGFEQRLRVPLLLDELYVPLEIAYEGRDSIERERASDKSSEQEHHAHFTSLISALEDATRSNHQKGLVLLGHPGAGKTMQLRRLALSLARGDLGQTALPEDLIPLLLPLRKLTEEDTSLRALAKRLLETSDLDFGAGFVDSLWEDSRLLLLIDGLDEVPQARRRHVRDWIENVGSSRHKHLAIVSCRYQGYTADAQLGQRFRAFSLRPLSDDSRARFIERWYEAVETGLLPDKADKRQGNEARTKARESAADLTAKLREQGIHAPRIYELAANPMLLTSICLVHRDRGGLPDRIDELYKEAVEILLEHWRTAKGLPPTYKATLARQVLQPVALWLHGEEGRTQASELDLRRVLKPIMQEVGWTDLEPLTFLATIRDESGLLTGWSSERYGFLHLGFQEYLAAQELYNTANRGAGDPPKFARAIQAIVEHFGPTWWREVVALIFAIDEQGAFFTQLFREILKLEQLPEHRDLAQHCVRQARRFTPEAFLELLRQQADAGAWANRVEACELLLVRGKFDVEKADLAPALELLDRKPGKTSHSREEQWLAAQLVQRLAPAELIKRAESLRSHPHVALAELAQTLLRARLAKTKGVLAAAGTRLDAQTGCEFACIPGGRFLMGSPENEARRSADEGPQHDVEVSAFELATFPVTNEQYAKYLEANTAVSIPDYWADRRYNQPRQPVVGVSWEDAQTYCKWAGYRLPTEAEWEYACRAGTTTRYWSGDDDTDLDRVGWYEGNSGEQLHAVAEKPANPYGLFDMHGNVWEWCEDDWSADYQTSMKTHPKAFKQQGSMYRVNRGGSCFRAAEGARSAYRDRWDGSRRGLGVGFRPARCITTA